MISGPASLKNKRIAYACLDWGLGHVMRSIDVIHELTEQGNSVVFCGNRKQIEVVRTFLPEIETSLLNQEEIYFKGDNRFWLEGVRNMRVAMFSASRIQKQIDELLSKTEIDVFISDHLYGFYSRLKPSIFITHQYHLPPKTPWLVSKLHHKWMKRFGQIWLVDDAQINVAGVLTQSTEKGHFIGLRSRFSLTTESQFPTIKGLGVLLLSGPEVYGKQLLSLFPKELRKHVVLITPYSLTNEEKEGFQACVIQNWHEADKWITQAEVIIGRNGYSTLMDVLTLNKKAILIPTKGQKEQEYLGDFAYPKIQTAKSEFEFTELLRQLFDGNAS